MDLVTGLYKSSHDHLQIVKREVLPPIGTKHCKWLKVSHLYGEYPSTLGRYTVVWVVTISTL